MVVADALCLGLCVSASLPVWGLGDMDRLFKADGREGAGEPCDCAGALLGRRVKWGSGRSREECSSGINKSRGPVDLVSFAVSRDGWRALLPMPWLGKVGMCAGVSGDLGLGDSASRYGLASWTEVRPPFWVHYPAQSLCVVSEVRSPKCMACLRSCE